MTCIRTHHDPRQHNFCFMPLASRVTASVMHPHTPHTPRNEGAATCTTAHRQGPREIRAPPLVTCYTCARDLSSPVFLRLFRSALKCSDGPTPAFGRCAPVVLVLRSFPSDTASYDMGPRMPVHCNILACANTCPSCGGGFCRRVPGGHRGSSDGSYAVYSVSAACGGRHRRAATSMQTRAFRHNVQDPVPRETFLTHGERQSRESRGKARGHAGGTSESERNSPCVSG